MARGGLGVGERYAITVGGYGPRVLGGGVADCERPLSGKLWVEAE